MKVNETGFTIVEVIAVLVIAGIIGTYGLQQLQAKGIDATVDNAARKANMVATAAKQYRLNTGSWPSNISQLVSNNYLTNSQATSAFNTNYSFSVVGSSLVITNQAADQRYARRMAGILPEGVNSGNMFSFMIPPPGHEASLSSLYALDGSRKLTGPMDVNDNDINNVRTLRATTGNITTVNSTDVSASGTVQGGRLYSQGNVAADVNVTAGQNIQSGRDLFVGQHAVVEGYAEIKGDVYARNNLTVSNTVQAGSINSFGNITANGIIQSNTDVRASRDITAARDLYSQRVIDLNNNSRYLDPSATSNLQNLSLHGGLYLHASVVRNTACSSRAVGMGADGTLYSCVGGVWSAPASSQLKYKNFSRQLVSEFASTNRLASTNTRSVAIPAAVLNDDPVSLDIQIQCWNGGGPHYYIGVGTNSGIIRNSLAIHEHGHVQGARLTIPREPGSTHIFYRNYAYSANQNNFWCNGTDREATFWITLFGYQTYN